MNAKVCLILIIAVIGINVGIAYMLKQKKSLESGEAVSSEQLGQEYKDAHENAAKAMLRCVITSQECYKTLYKQYALSFKTLVGSGILTKEDLMGCSRPGVDSKPISEYVYQMTAGKAWTKTSFFARCKPVDEDSDMKCFSVDSNGKVKTIPRY